MLARSQFGGVEENIGDGCKHAVAAVGLVGPALTAVAVPRIEGFVVGDLGHLRSPSKSRPSASGTADSSVTPSRRPSVWMVRRPTP